MNEFMIGVNYWDSKSGTDMWRNFDVDVIDKDLKALSQIGVKHLRVFPNWRDFQPIKMLYGHQGDAREYAFCDTDMPIGENVNGIDYVMIDHFRVFANIAKKYDMKLTVGVVTGWMSGRLFCPPALDGKNLITDPEALMLTARYIKGLVSAIKDLENIVMWDLGNECNNLGKTANRYQAYTWSVLVANTIRSVDNTRPIASGMHGLGIGEMATWSLDFQGEICDYMTTHPYPSPSIAADLEPYNGMRTTIFPTAQSLLYSHISGRPCIIQEQGVFSEMIGNRDMAAQFVRVNMFSAWANNLSGYFYWCGTEHTKLDNAPYRWIAMERQLGILDVNSEPKPAGLAMKHVQEVVSKLSKPVRKQTDAICVLTNETNKQHLGMSSYVLGAEAGFQIEMQDCDSTIGIADVYIMPSILGWRLVPKKTLDFVLDRVKNHGAKLMVTFNNGSFIHMEETFGLRSFGVRRSRCSHTAHFKSGDIKYYAETELFVKSVGAEVLAENEDGNVVFSRNKYGEGYVYFLGFSVELNALNATDGYKHEVTQPFSNVYKEFAEELTQRYVLKTDNPNISVVQSYDEEDNMYVSAINYSDKAIKPEFTISDEYDISVCYGNIDEIDACDALIVKAVRK